MQPTLFFARYSLLVVTLAIHGTAQAELPAYSSELFGKTELVYEDNFDDTTLNADFWEIRQSSTWEIQDGILTGSESSKEFQAERIAAGDKAHAGFKPVIWLKQIPESFVCAMRVRYNAEDYIPRFPLFDIGHHIHTLTFSAAATDLTIKMDAEQATIAEPLFSLNEWHDVVIELKKGSLLFVVDGKKHLFESPAIDMTGHAQIDFKGIDFGSCQIDNVRIWKGL